MINPALKSALIRWQQTETAMRHAQVQCVAEEFVAWNSRRIAALEDLRKLVEKGEFDSPILNPTHKISHWDGRAGEAAFREPK